MSRFEDWPQRLDAAVEAARTRAFAWGSFDCCLWAADVALAITGEDPAAIYRGAYHDEAGAAALIAQHGSLAALVTALLGPPIHPAWAHRADLVLAHLTLEGGGTGDSVGVCLGHHCAFTRRQGLVFVPRVKVSAAWKVGR
jgi:hypothetical protein